MNTPQCNLMSKRLQYAFQLQDASLQLRLNGKGGFSRSRRARVPPQTTLTRSNVEGNGSLMFANATAEQKIAAYDYLGLSKVANLHTPLRAMRGAKGITSEGRNKVECAAIVLEQTYGKELLSFATFTLPSQVQSRDELNPLGEKIDSVYPERDKWAALVKNFRQRLCRLLRLAGLPQHLIGCIEVQEKRFASGAGMPLHIHVVFVGRRKGESWGIKADTLRMLWRDLCVSFLQYSEDTSFQSSVDVQRVLKSVAGYLGKYISKGVMIVKECAGSALQDFLPSTWYICTRELGRIERDSRLRLTGHRAEQAFENLRENCERLHIELHAICVRMTATVKHLVGYALSFPRENIHGLCEIALSSQS